MAGVAQGGYPVVVSLYGRSLAVPLLVGVGSDYRPVLGSAKLAERLPDNFQKGFISVVHGYKTNACWATR